MKIIEAVKYKRTKGRYLSRNRVVELCPFCNYYHEVDRIKEVTHFSNSFPEPSVIGEYSQERFHCEYSNQSWVPAGIPLHNYERLVIAMLKAGYTSRELSRIFDKIDNKGVLDKYIKRIEEIDEEEAKDELEATKP